MAEAPHQNRLIHEKSPYLLQHAKNPVDWYPWGAEAFERAKKEDKPVFLSIGYSSCHWCHVMEHESFERDDVAAILNEHFICIKVDREERPDLDEIYMTATQLITGRGGWPNSVWLFPDGRPWFAGTYFPREDALGRVGFKTLLVRLDEFWKTRRPDAEQQAVQLSEAIRQASGAFAESAFDVTPASLRGLVDNAVSEFRRGYDHHNGGFGGAPKFPPHAALALLLEEYRWNQDRTLLALVTGTLDAMTLGGIHDHVGGGFHRYATDEHWFLPHFEKMLYDNAQLAAVYAEAFRATSNAAYAATARDTCDWVLREMTGPGGGFYSALDADSEGVEGKFYVWTHDEILGALGDEDGKQFCAAYNIEPGGNYREEASGESTGANIPFLKKALDPAQADRLAACRAKLLARRVRRVWPALDDKVIASWNGLMIGALARAGAALDEPRYIEAAARAAAFVKGQMTRDKELLRIWRDGQARIPAYLDDYVFMANGLLDLHEATGDAQWKEEALNFLRIVSERFGDDRGGFFYNSPGHEQLLARTRDPFDQALPSANAAAALLLIRAYDLDGDAARLDEARRCVVTFARFHQRAPTAAATFMVVSARLAERMGKGTEGTDGTKGTARVQKGPVIIEGRFASTNEVEVRLVIEKGWHVNANKPSMDNLIATAVSADGVAKLKYPKPVKKKVGPDTLDVYEGDVVIRGEVASKGASAPLKISVTFQPCDDTRCLKPETVTLDVPTFITGM